MNVWWVKGDTETAIEPSLLRWSETTKLAKAVEMAGRGEETEAVEKPTAEHKSDTAPATVAPGDPLDEAGGALASRGAGGVA